METTVLLRKTKSAMSDLMKEAEFSLLALRGAIAEAETEQLRAKTAIDYQDRDSVLVAKHAFERYSAITLAAQEVSGIVSAAKSALRSLDLRNAEWEVYVARNEIAA